MADPIVKKITQLTEATSIAADDLIAIVDVSETIAANKTKKAIARLIKLYNSSQITDGIVTDSKIASSAVTDTKIASNAVTTTKIADNAVTNSKIADNAISPAKTSFMPISSVDNTVPRFDSTGGKLQTSGVVIGDDNRLSLTTSGIYAMIIKGKDTSVSSYTILCRNSEDSNTFYVCNDGTVVAPRFQGDIVKLGAVGTNAIADGAVTAIKLATDAVETAKIKDANVTTAKIADGAVTGSKIAANAVETVKIKDANVTTAKIATGAVETAKIKDANVTTAKIADGAVTAGKLASGAVETVKIKDANVTTAKIADGAVTVNKLAGSIVPYIGKFYLDGTLPTSDYILPTGWSVVRLSQGKYRVTHNFGSRKYLVILSGLPSSVVGHSNEANNTFDIESYSLSSNPNDNVIHFVVYKFG